MHILENEKISLSLSDKGLITSLKNRATGHEYITYPEEDTWRLILYEGEVGKPKVGTMPYCWEIPIYSKDQKPLITSRDNTLTATYEGLKCADSTQGPSLKYAECAGLTGRDLDIKFAFHVSLEGDEAIWTVEVENNEDIGVGEIWCPMISGVTWLGPKKDDSLLMPMFYGRKFSKPLETMTEKRGGMLGLTTTPPMGSDKYPFRILYPGTASMQWYTLCNQEEGLYLASYDKSLQTTCLNVEKEKSEGKEFLSFTLAKYPFIEKGESWKSAPFVVSTYQGNWHVAAKKYKSWASTWMKKQKPPQWVRKMSGWQWNALKSQCGVVEWTYKEIPRLYREAKLGGLNTMWLVGWPHAGNDREYPDYPYNIDPRLGTEEDLKKSIRQVREEGGNIWLYNNARMIDPETEWYRKVGRRATMKTIWGNEYFDNWTYWKHGSLLDVGCNQYRLLTACPSTPEWFEVLHNYAKRSKELGSMAVFYDYWVHLFPYLCFDKSHNHKKPALAYGPGMVKTLKKVREEMTRDDPDFALISEGINDAAGQYLDAVQGVDRPGREMFPELIRYTFPEYILSNRETKGDDYHTLNWGYVYGLRFDIEIDFNRGTLKNAPELATQCKRLCEIRNRYSDLLLEGTFIDDEGFTIDNDRLVAKAHKNKEQLAIAVWNPREEGQSLQIEVPNYQLENVLSMEEESDQIPSTIKPNKVLTLIYRRK